MAIRSKETKYLSLLIENGIFHCYFKDVDLLDLPLVKESVQVRLELIEGKAYPCFFDITKVKNTTKDARDYIANEGNRLVKASAILISSPVQRMMANFYIMVNKPKNPTRMFTDKDSALEWLTQFKD